ncbi:MAG: alpha/beta fold hydrolase [Pseudomonadota bacterium]
MIQLLLDIVFYLVGVAVLAVVSAYAWQRYFTVPTHQDETRYFRTEDGWRLALHRYRPPDSKGLPVLLCHGLSANRYIFDLRGAASLACYLRDNGRDAWVVELRGSGMSDVPGILCSDVPRDWCFEDHLRFDVPAAIRQVLQFTSAPSVHWVGHSMGGMLIQAYLGTNGTAPIASAVTIGSPTDPSGMEMDRFSLLLKFKRIVHALPFFPLPLIGRVISPVAPWVADHIIGLFYGRNLAPTTIRRVMALMAEIVTSSQLWLDFARFLETGRFGPSDGTRYTDGLSASKVPLLAIGGTKDGMAPPRSVCGAVQEANAAGERKCLLLGKSSGCVEDYGHCDLLVGYRSESEVFPHILDWIETHDHAVGD